MYSKPVSLSVSVCICLNLLMFSFLVRQRCKIPNNPLATRTYFDESTFGWNGQTPDTALFLHRRASSLPTLLFQEFGRG